MYFLPVYVLEISKVPFIRCMRPLGEVCYFLEILSGLGKRLRIEYGRFFVCLRDIVELCVLISSSDFNF